MAVHGSDKCMLVYFKNIFEVINFPYDFLNSKF